MHFLKLRFNYCCDVESYDCAYQMTNALTFLKKGLENDVPHVSINVSDDNVNNSVLITAVFLYLMMKTLYNDICLLNIYIFENLKSVRTSFIYIFFLITPFSLYV